MKLGLLSMIYERRQTTYVLHEEATEQIQKVSLKAVFPQDRIVLVAVFTDTRNIGVTDL